MIDRKRQVNLESLSDEQLELISKEISKSVSKEFNEMKRKCKKFLDVYGLDITVIYKLHIKGEEPELGLSQEDNKD